jgi:hypothetical protein
MMPIRVAGPVVAALALLAWRSTPPHQFSKVITDLLLAATDLGFARSVPAFWVNSQVVPPIEKRANGKMKLGTFRGIVAIEPGGSTDLAEPRSVAPNTESISRQRSCHRFSPKALRKRGRPA